MVYLGSRKNFCINEKVSKMKTLSQMNENCLDLQKNVNQSKEEKEKEKKLSNCNYYLNRKSQNLLTDHILADISEIEDIIDKGKKLNACPYYSSRSSVPSAEVFIFLILIYILIFI